MRFFALLLGLMGATGPLTAQAVVGAPTDVDGAVREAVADAWGIPSDAVVLEQRPDDAPLDGVSVELVGSGSGGSWVARMRDENDRVTSQRIRAGRRVRLPVAARRLSRGTVLAEADIELRDVVQWGPPDGSGPRRLTGWVTQRILAKGDVLTEPAVRAPSVVSPGDRVELHVRRGGVRVDAVAVAAGAGAIGDAVYVRTESGKRVRGVVVGPGAIAVMQAGADNLGGNAR